MRKGCATELRYATITHPGYHGEGTNEEARRSASSLL